MSAKIQGSRKRHGHEARILAGEEEDYEFRPSFSNNGYAGTSWKTESGESSGNPHGLFTQLHIGEDVGQVPPSIIEVHRIAALRGIIECFGKRVEISASKCQPAASRIWRIAHLAVTHSACSCSLSITYRVVAQRPSYPITASYGKFTRTHMRAHERNTRELMRFAARCLTVPYGT